MEGLVGLLVQLAVLFNNKDNKKKKLEQQQTILKKSKRTRKNYKSSAVHQGASLELELTGLKILLVQAVLKVRVKEVHRILADVVVLVEAVEVEQTLAVV